MKKIYIDGLGLVEGHFSGVGQYILGVLKGIDLLIEESKISGSPMPIISIIIPCDCVNRFKEFGFKHISYKKFPLPFRYMAALWHRGKLPPIDLWLGSGTYIFPRFVDMPLLFSKSAGLVIFDLSYELYKKYSDEGNAQFLSSGVRASVARTSNVIAISKNARQEIINFYKLPPNRVKVATPATDETVFYRRSLNEIKSVKEKYGIKGDYILALSNLEPRKNLGSLIEAYCKLPQKIRNNNSLLLVGVNGWKTEQLFENIIEKVEKGFKIIRPSHYVSDEDKPAIISGAKMLVYPSHYEGFGMPPLEALACGTPVISANNSSLPEVVGRAARLIDIEKNGELLKSMIDYFDNLEKISQRVITEGPEQASKFSWKLSAKTFLEIANETD